jgi:hypothetical protein
VIKAKLCQVQVVKVVNSLMARFAKDAIFALTRHPERVKAPMANQNSTLVAVPAKNTQGPLALNSYFLVKAFHAQHPAALAAPDFVIQAPAFVLITAVKVADQPFSSMHSKQ